MLLEAHSPAPGSTPAPAAPALTTALQTVGRRGGPSRTRPPDPRLAPAPLRGCAGFLRQGLNAVSAGLALPWGSGSTDGTVCRVKAIKRPMCGRASFRLLRIRILTRVRADSSFDQ